MDYEDEDRIHTRILEDGKLLNAAKRVRNTNRRVVQIKRNIAKLDDERVDLLADFKTAKLDRDDAVCCLDALTQ